MSDPQLPVDTNEARFRALEERVKTLERFGTSGLASSGSTFTSVDPDGNRRVSIGNLGDDHYGAQILDSTGAKTFYVDENGMDAPQVLVPMDFTAMPQVVNISDTVNYASISYCYLPILSHPAFRIYGTYNFSDGTTAGRIRIYLDGAVAIYGPSFVAGSSGTWQLDWLHGKPLGVDKFMSLHIQAKAGTGSTGSFNCLPPTVIMTNNTHRATAEGFWTMAA